MEWPFFVFFHALRRELIRSSILKEMSALIRVFLRKFRWNGHFIPNLLNYFYIYTEFCTVEKCDDTTLCADTNN